MSGQVDGSAAGNPLLRALSVARSIYGEYVETGHFRRRAERGAGGEERRGDDDEMCWGKAAAGCDFAILHFFSLSALEGSGWQAALTGPKTHPIRTKCVV